MHPVCGTHGALGQALTWGYRNWRGVVAVADDDTDARNEPEAVTSAATVRSVNRMGSYVSSIVGSVMTCLCAVNELTTSVFQ